MMFMLSNTIQTYRKSIPPLILFEPLGQLFLAKLVRMGQNMNELYHEKVSFHGYNNNNDRICRVQNGYVTDHNTLVNMFT